MDLTSLDRVRAAHDRTDLLLGPGSAPLAGGTWLFSEPQPDLTELVDLTSLRWPAIEVTPEGLSVAATCTIRELVDLPPVDGWASQHLVERCARSLVASEKIWDWATVGGNICLALPAGALTTWAVALDATAVVWTPDGGERRQPVASFVTGVRATTLAPGEVLRAVVVPAEVLARARGLPPRRAHAARALRRDRRRPPVRRRWPRRHAHRGRPAPAPARFRDLPGCRRAARRDRRRWTTGTTTPTAPRTGGAP